MKQPIVNNNKKPKNFKKVAIIVSAILVLIGSAAIFKTFVFKWSIVGRDGFFADLCLPGRVAVHAEEYDDGSLKAFKCGKKPACETKLFYTDSVLPDDKGRIYSYGTLKCQADYIHDCDSIRKKAFGPEGNYWDAMIRYGDCFPTVDKPIIYLYPEKEQNIDVRLDFDGKVFASYPNYVNGGWKVMAHPNGTIIHDGQEYSYLFWEGKPSSERHYDFSTGFVVKGSETREFLQKKLAEIGLTPKEYNEFIVYWYPKMQDSTYNLVHFATYDEYDKYTKLNITPAPDSMLRVFMVFKPLESPTNVTPQVFPSFERKGFTVVEWGGSELN